MMSQYKLYCVNENRNLIVRGFNTTDKKVITTEVKKCMSKLYPGKKINENLIVTSNPQNYGLDPQNESSWLNVKKEIRNEAIIQQLTNQIYESMTKYSPEKLQEGEINTFENNKVFQETIKKLVAQNINESLTDAYEQTINEAFGDKFGTGVRNMFSWGGNGTIPPKTYAAARDLGRAYKKFKAAWMKYTPFLGDNPQDENYYAEKPLAAVENAIRTIPRFEAVQVIERPRRQELIGKYFVSNKNHDRIVQKKAELLSKQQIEKAKADAAKLVNDANALRKQETAQNKRLIADAMLHIDTLNQTISKLQVDNADLDKIAQWALDEAVKAEQAVSVLKNDAKISTDTINKLNKDLADIKGLFAAAQQAKRDMRRQRNAETQRANQAQATIDSYQNGSGNP